MSFDNIHVLLHQIEGPINLGAVCRAMANTGFQHLAYTGPLEANEGEARKFALHARHLLEGAHKHEDLLTLTSGYDLVFGFTPRNPQDDGRGLDLDGFHREISLARSAGKRIGLLFGNEARGLQNADLVQCHFRVALPTHDDYVSMNLSQAVMVVLWELRRHHGETIDAAANDPELVGPEEKRALLNNIRGFLETIEFLNPQNPDHIFDEVIPLFQTRDWTKRELTLLHAIFGKARSRYLASLRKLTRIQEES